MNTPSLNGFLALTGAKFRLFDLGLNLQKLPEKTLQSLDDGQAYPRPHLGFAWLVVFMWNPEQNAQNSLWFLKLPLDEQGILPAGVHADLVKRLYKALEVADPAERQKILTEHPYQFTPEPEKMAALHAVATATLGHAKSDFFKPAQDYFQHPEHAAWQNIGIQGIADYVWHLSETELSALTQRLANFQPAPLFALLSQFGHRQLPTPAVEALVDFAHHQPSADVVSACLRACGQSSAKKLWLPFIEQQIDQIEDLNLVLTLISFYFQSLATTQAEIKLLERLALLADADGFSRVVTNLAMQPNNQGFVMRILRSEFLTAPLANALSQLIQQQRHGQHEPH